MQGVRGGYGDTTVLHDISLAVHEGEAVGLLGPNGHGKTTLLRTVSGLNRASAGEIRFQGADITHLAPHKIVRKGLIHVPERDLLFGDMTVEENLMVGAYLSSAWRDRTSRLGRVWELFPALETRRSALAQHLSGGERRMTAIGRGLMADARMLMLDEPLFGLAPAVVKTLGSTLAVLRQSGLTLLVVEETTDRIASLVDRLYLLDTGRIVAQGTTEEVANDTALLEAYLG